MSGYGRSYEVSWWGDVNAPNGWGSIYPFDADGSTLSADTNLDFADNSLLKADATQY